MRATAGTFVGLEPMPNLRDPVQPGAHRFHQNTLTIRGTHATLNKIPVAINAGKMSYPKCGNGVSRKGAKQSNIPGTFCPTR